MIHSSNIIVIEGDAATEFMESIRHPDPEYAQRLTELFQQFDRLFSPPDYDKEDY